MSTLLPAAGPQAERVVASLVEAHLLDPTQREHARGLVDRALRERSEAPSPRGMSSLVEVVAYLGTALVLAAGALFLLDVWGELGLGTQVGTVGVLAAVLAAGGAAVLAGHATAVARRAPSADPRRRLAGTLLTGAALAVAFLVGLLVDRLGGSPAWDETGLDWTLLTASAAGLAVAAVGYRLAPGAVGMLGLAAGLGTLVPTLVTPWDTGLDATLLASALLLSAALWLVLVEAGVLGEATLGRVLGVLLALTAAQTPVVEDGQAGLGYLLTAAVAVAGTTLYLRRGAWPYLAVAVLAITVVVPEAVTDWTDGGLGAVGAVLLTGVTLLLASLAGAALRHRRGDDGA